MSSEILLISEIEQRPCLYNYTLHEYNKKEILEQAWTEIALSCQMTVAECKDKWKNIRSSYVRSLKTAASAKSKKPYYLSSYLQFITPFLKTIDFNNEDESAENNVSDSDVPLVTVVKEEPVDIDAEMTPGQSNYRNEGNSIEMEVTKPHVLTINPRGTVLRKRRRVIMPHNSLKMRRVVPQSTNNVPSVRTEVEYQNPMQMFLLSLLPEFDMMKDFQIRLFKIKVMMLIDDIKTKSEEVRKTLKSDNEENLRLQKKLINLLLKRLKRNES